MHPFLTHGLIARHTRHVRTNATAHPRTTIHLTNTLVWTHMCVRAVAQSAQAQQLQVQLEELEKQRAAGVAQAKQVTRDPSVCLLMFTRLGNGACLCLYVTSVMIL